MRESLRFFKKIFRYRSTDSIQKKTHAKHIAFVAILFVSLAGFGQNINISGKVLNFSLEYLKNILKVLLEYLKI